MKSSVTTLEGNKVRLSVEVPESEFDVEVEKAFKKIGSEVKLPGFRKGKVPRKVLEARFGKDIARSQALEDSIPNLFIDAIKTTEIDMIGRPEYEITGGEETGDVTFDVVIETRPEVEIADYEGLKVEVGSVEPDEEAINKRLQVVAEQFSELEPVERECKDGDIVLMDITATHNGEVIEGLTAKGYSFQVGSVFPIAEVNRQLIGVKGGESLQFSSEHPTSDGDIDFVIDVSAVQENVVPELTEEMVKNGTTYDSIEEFQQEVEAELRFENLKRISTQWREHAGDALASKVDIDIPESLIEIEVEDRLKALSRRLQANGMDLQRYFQITGQDPEAFVKELNEPAVLAVKLDLALRALAKAEGITVGDDELETEFEEIAKGTKMSAAEIKAEVNTPNQLMMVRTDIVKRRAAEWFFEHIVISDDDGNVLDLEALEEELKTLEQAREAAEREALEASANSEEE